MRHLLPRLLLVCAVLPALAVAMSSWFAIPADSQFSLQNIPFGVGLVPPRTATAAATAADGAAAGSSVQPEAHIMTAIGDHVLDLHVLAKAGVFPTEYAATLTQVCAASPPARSGQHARAHARAHARTHVYM